MPRAPRVLARRRAPSATQESGYPVTSSRRQPALALAVLAMTCGLGWVVEDVSGAATPLTGGSPESVADAAAARPGVLAGTVLRPRPWEPASITDLGNIPGRAVAAYRHATVLVTEQYPNCGLQWQLLAAIGAVEGDHGRHGSSSLNPRTGLTTPPIFGPVLDGKGKVARVIDTDHGRMDHLRRLDRAVGPMQFLPSTWRRHAVDGDRDQVLNPQDVDDAATTAGTYLCRSGWYLGTLEGRIHALLSYNRSAAYVNTVLGLYRAYLAGDYYAEPVLYHGPLELPEDRRKRLRAEKRAKLKAERLAKKRAEQRRRAQAEARRKAILEARRKQAALEAKRKAEAQKKAQELAEQKAQQSPSPGPSPSP